MTSMTLAEQSPTMLKCTILLLRNAWMLDGGTPWMVLSAAIDNPTDTQPHAGPSSIVLLAPRTRS